MIFSLVATLAVGEPTVASSGHHALPDLGSIAALRNDARIAMVTSDLAVNTDPSRRLVVPDKCESQGQAELERLTEASVEESFVFIPSHCMWIEVGYGETGTGVRLDAPFISRLLLSFDTLIVYHTHVVSTAAVAGYFPAYRDLLGVLLINGPVLRNSSYQIFHRAVTRVGIFEYRFEMSPSIDQLLVTLVGSGLGDFVAQNLAYLYSGGDREVGYNLMVTDCGRRAAEDASRLGDCFPMRVGNFELRFQLPSGHDTTGPDD